MRRFLTKALVAIVAVTALVCAVAYWYLRQSLPQIDGSVTVAGISAPVDIVRDADAIPHIFAATKLDALYGLGYVHAQDRLWEMELQRRIGYGRLSEIFGAPTIPQDRFLRTVGYGRAARAAWASLPGDAKQQVNAYVAGINAFLETHHGRALPPEFTLLRFEPQPWDGADVIAWVKMMAWDLSANYPFELLRHDLVARVGADRMLQLMPPYAEDGLSIMGNTEGQFGSWNSEFGMRHRRPPPGAASAIPNSQLPIPDSRGSASPVSSAAAFLWSTALAAGNPTVRDFLVGNTTTEALGSNNWVVDGTLSATGKPLLANDPHLNTRLPSTWYLAHLSAGEFDVIGATLPGGPGVVLGRNRRIAWGMTNVAADVEDLYRERLDPTGRFAEFAGVQEPLRFIPETIVVKGADPVRIEVRISRHGPLVSDAINANNAELKRTPRPDPLEPLAFRWTALDPDDTSVAAMLRVNEARTWTDFTAALEGFIVPSQNIVYADVDGHIGYYAPGRIPIRAAGDGSLPAEGWTGAAEWTGWIPFAELPHAFDPPEHFIVTANNRPAPPSYPHLLGLEWPEPYRAQRITDLIRGTMHGAAGHAGRLTVDDFAAMQADTVSLHAKAVLPALLAHARPASAPDQQAVAILRDWNGDARGDRAAPALFEAWFLRLAPAIAGDDLGRLALESYQSRTTFVTRFVLNTLAADASGWCDDRQTPKTETCDDAVTTALHEAVTQLTGQLGSDMPRWRWDAVHRAVFPHQGLDSVAALRPLLSRSMPNGGDWSTVNVGPVSAERPFEQRAVPGYREIIDLSPANDSRFLDAVGQSGHPLSPHYADFLSDWHDVKHRRMRMERADVERGALGRLTLTPR